MVYGYLPHAIAHAHHLLGGHAGLAVAEVPVRVRVRARVRARVRVRVRARVRVRVRVKAMELVLTGRVFRARDAPPG